MKASFIEENLAQRFAVLFGRPCSLFIVLRSFFSLDLLAD